MKDDRSDKNQNMDDLAAKTLSRLRAEWGSEFETKLNKAKRAAQKNPELIAFLDASGLGDDRQIVKLFAELGEDVALDDETDDKASGRKKSPHARVAKALTRAVMRGGKRTAYFDGPAGDHEEMVEVMRKLYEMSE
jgi:hypothetical protein